jgi:predicted aspartyl protease
MPAYDDERFHPPAPVARVLIRNPDLGDEVVNVPMLIDTGADASLLPRSVVASLGIVGTGERLQLLAFDGSASDSETVRADLVFLGRRFRGHYLVIDAEVGVFGRDLLNHLRLFLDGPSLTWAELPKVPPNV